MSSQWLFSSAFKFTRLIYLISRFIFELLVDILVLSYFLALGLILHPQIGFELSNFKCFIKFNRLKLTFELWLEILNHRCFIKLNTARLTFELWVDVKLTGTCWFYDENLAQDTLKMRLVSHGTGCGLRYKLRRR